MIDQHSAYDHQALLGLPVEMDPWGATLELGQPTESGQYVLVGCEPADIESHHQVLVIDEDGRPLGGVGVLFAFSTGPAVAPRPRVNYWTGAPRILNGNYQRTNLAGEARHTFGEGGETIWVWDVRSETLELSSDVVFDCRWIPERFNHTGLKLTFQRRRKGIVPIKRRLADIEDRLTKLEAARG